MRIAENETREREIDAARVRFSEINQNPDREAEVGRDLASNFSPEIQQAAQGSNDLPSVQEANALHSSQGNSEDLPSVQVANQQHAPGLHHVDYGTMQDQEAGGLVAAGKGLLGVPGFIGGAANAISGMARGDKPSEALEGMMGAGQDFGDKAFNSILNMLPTATAKKLYELSENHGSQAVSEFIGKMFNMGPVGQGWGNIAALLGAHPELAKQIDAGVQLAENIGLLAGNPRLGKERPQDFSKGGAPPEGSTNRVEPSLRTEDINVSGRAEPKLNDYEQLGIDSSREPQMGQMPNVENQSIGPRGPMDYTLRQESTGQTWPNIPGRQEPPMNAPPGPHQFKESIPQVDLNTEHDQQSFNFGNGPPLLGGAKKGGGILNPADLVTDENGMPHNAKLSEEAWQQEREHLGQQDMFGPNPEAPKSQPAPERRGQGGTIEFPLENPKVRNFGNARADKSELYKADSDEEAARTGRETSSRISGESESTFTSWVTTLPDKVTKDPIVARHIKRIKDQMDYLNTKLEEYRQGALDATRVRQGEVGRTKQSQKKGGDLDRLEKQVQNEQTILENMGSQLYERLQSKHPYQEPWFPQKEGEFGKVNKGASPEDVPPKSTYQTGTPPAGIQHSSSPEGFRGQSTGHPFGKGQAGAITPGVFGEGLAKILGKGKTPADLRKSLGYDEPTGTAGKLWHQFDTWHTKTAADALREAEKRGPLQDISPNREMSIKNLFSGKTSAILTEHIAGSGEVIKFVNDKIRNLDRVHENLTKQILGFKYAVTGKLQDWKSLVKDPDGIFSVWDHPKTTKEDIAGMHGTALKSMFDLKEPVREDFTNEKQWKMYSAIRTGLNKTLGLVNDVRSSIGLPKIQQIPGFLPTQIRGGYRLIGKDAKGATKYIIGTDVRGSVNKWIVGGLTMFTEKPLALTEVKARLEKAHPDLNFKEIDLSHTDKTKLGDLSAFEETMRALSKNDPVARAVHRTYVKILQSRGFGSHALQRKGGWEGFQGSGEGYKAAKDMRNSIETYINQAMQYRSNILKQGVYRELLEAKGMKWTTQKDENGNPKTIPSSMLEKEIPHTMSYIKDYIDHSMNKDLNAWDYLDDAVLKLSHNFGFGKNYPIQVVNKLGNLASMFWLTTPRFIMSQGLQHLNFAPQMIKQLGMSAMEDGTKSWLKGWEQYVHPDDISKRAVGWASENGYLEKKIINAFDSGYDISTRLGHIKDSSDVLNFTKELAPKLSKYALGTVEQQLVRIPTFLWAEQALRSTMKDDVARFSRAAEMVDHYMVNYTKSERPMVYNRLGLGGVFLGKLKSYSHNFYGQFFEYLGDIKRSKPKSVLPMSSFLVNNLFQAGLKGMVGFEVINGAMNVLNWLNNTTFPTPEELMYASGMSDTWIFGGASKLTGLLMHHSYDFSGSTSAPGLSNMASIPALSMAASMGQGAKTILDMVKGEATPGEKFTALKENLPAWAAGLVEHLYSPDGKIVPRANGGDITSDYTRDTEEWLVRSIIGARSLEEAAKSAEMSIVNRRLERDNEVSARMMSVMYEQWKHGNGIDPDTLNKYMFSEMKGPNGEAVIRSSPEKLETALVDKLKKELLSRASNMLIKSQPNLATAERLDRLQQFGLLMNRSDTTPKDILDMHKQLSNQGY